jgi:hypothetical protein
MSTKQIVESLGNIPAVRGTIYADNKSKPEFKLESGQRVSWQRFKTTKDKEGNETLRKPIAVIVNEITPSAIIRGNEKGTEFLQSLVNEFQDGEVKLSAEGKQEFTKCESLDALIASYFDSSRASGVTKETVAAFFDDAMQGWLVSRIVAKYPQMETDKVAKVAEQYKASFCDLAKYQMPHTKPAFELLSKAHKEFAYPEQYQDMAEWIAERLQKLHDRHNASEMLMDAI